MNPSVTRLYCKGSNQTLFAILTETSTGHSYGVNWSHVESISVTEGGTLIAFASGDTVTVRESFMDVIAAVRAGD